MKVLINYANMKYQKAQSFNTWTGKHIAKFDKIIEYTPKDIDPEFRLKNSAIFSIDRGDGLWLWKPYIIKKTLDDLEYGDILFYCDSGAFFIRKINKLIESMGENDIWLSGLPLIEKQYTKMETVKLMDSVKSEYINSNQVSGTIIIIRKSEFSANFIDEWLKYCSDIRILSGHVNTPGIVNDIKFIQHREDQSILSLLSKKYNISRHKDPSQYGKLPEKYKGEGRIFKIENFQDRYPVCLIHHRTADVNLKVCVKQLLCVFLPRKISLRLIKN